MKKYRVYQNITQFAITIEAKNSAEAILIAKKDENRDQWDEYDQTDDDVFYDTVEWKEEL